MITHRMFLWTLSEKSPKQECTETKGTVKETVTEEWQIDGSHVSETAKCVHVDADRWEFEHFQINITLTKNSAKKHPPDPLIFNFIVWKDVGGNRMCIMCLF